MRPRTRTATAYVTGGPQSTGRDNRENELADLPARIEQIRQRAREELWRLTYACDDPIAKSEIPGLRVFLRTPLEQILAELAEIHTTPTDQWRNRNWPKGGDRLDLCDDADGG